MSAPRQHGRGSYRSGVSFGALSFISMAVLGILSSIVMARLFGVRVVGQYALASAPATSLWFLSTVKEQTALIKRLTTLQPRDPEVTGLWAAVFAFSMTLTVVMAGLVVVGTYFVFRGPVGHPELFGPAVACMVGYVFIINVGWNVDGVFSAFVAGRELFWIRLHQTVAALAWFIAAGIVRDDLWGLIAATYLSVITALVHRMVLIRRYMRLRVPWHYVRDGFSILPAIIRFGLRMAPGSVAQGFAGQSATYLLGLFNTLSAVGAFNRALVLTSRFQDLTTKITEMLFPTLVARREAGDGRGFDRALIDTLRYSTLMMLVVASVGGGGAFAIMDLFGPGFAAAAPAFSILMLLPAVTTVAVIQSYALYAVDRPGLASWIAIGRLVVTVALGYGLTRAIGLEGAAIGLVGGAVFDVVWKSVVVRQYLTRPVRELWSLRQMVAAGVAYAGGFVAAHAVHELVPALAALPLTLAAGAWGFAALFYFGGGLNERDRERIEQVTRRRLAIGRVRQA